jgi:adenosylmethionine-8-amino-7-oxononanoate aminotransferase
VIYKNLSSRPIRIVGGAGARLYDDRGNEYLDACGGVCVSGLGHNHPRVVEAIREQAGKISWAHAGSFTTDPAEELAEYLVGLSEGLSYVQFLSSGSEAMELALKTAYQYHWERGEPERQVFVARRQNFHGSTFATLAISGNAQRRSIFEPLLRPAVFVSPCYAYRDRLESETDEDYVARLARELESAVLELGPEKVAGFVAETVVGSTSGAVPPVEGYFRAIKEVCERYGMLLILDEVMAGLGRTGRHFAYQDDGIVPDVVAVGKGLAEGYQPISAMLVTKEVYDALATGSGVLRNGQTYVNHPVACAAALCAQRTIAEEGLLDQVRTRGAQLRSLLEELKETVPYVGDVRGRGLFLGVELVADQETKEPLPVEFDFATRMKAVAFEHGLLTYPGSGTIDGVRGHHVLFAPPFVATESDVAEIAERFEAALTTVLREKERGDSDDLAALVATEAVSAEAQGRRLDLSHVLTAATEHDERRSHS